MSGSETLSTVGDQYLLYQGTYIEYPLYVARGEANEIVYLIPGTDVAIDHFNVDVYVKSTTTEKWAKWSRVESLYLENATATKFETIGFQDCISKNLKVMDMTAFTLCMENKLPLIVFDMNQPGNLMKLVKGDAVGTLVG
jgi:hypothetical protein